MKVGYQEGAQPHINWKHIDGPLLCLRYGGIHWLTLWERIQLKLGWTDIYQLEIKHWAK